MAVLFQSDSIVHSNEAKHELSNVNISDADRNIRFSFTKNGEVFNPQEAEYSFSTKVFSMTPKAGQLSNGDVVVMQIEVA